MQHAYDIFRHKSRRRSPLAVTAMAGMLLVAATRYAAAQFMQHVKCLHDSILAYALQTQQQCSPSVVTTP